MEGLGVTLLLEKEGSKSEACHQERGLLIGFDPRGDGRNFMFDFLRRVTREVKRLVATYPTRQFRWLHIPDDWD